MAAPLKPGNWYYVITGASGAGKSTLIAALRELGYATVPETANTILREQRKLGGTLLPATDRKAFMQAVFERSVADFERAATYAGPVFFDRAIPEWLRFLGWKQAACQQALAKYRYAAKVFVAQPWAEIYQRDDERVHHFDQAVASYPPTVSAYTDAGYQVCSLPQQPVAERVTFVLNEVAADAGRHGS
ncbi:AAA family ATPase [Bremerella cremea]|uniref:AAA family ATPase n=1 Tax=Bremerella cremea TaxID=1031537 RepID=UPI0031EFFB92